MNNVTTYSYTPDCLSGILRYDSRTGTVQLYCSCILVRIFFLPGAFGRRLMSSTPRLFLQ